MGLGILGPRNSQVGQVSFSEYMIGVGLGAMGSTDFTKLLSLLSIAQRLEWRGQTQKDGGSNPSKVEFLNLIAENKPGQHSVDRPPSLLVANRYGPTIVRTNVQTLKGDFDQPEKFWGPLFMGPCWLSSNVQSAPSIPMLPSFHKWRALLN